MSKLNNLEEFWVKRFDHLKAGDYEAVYDSYHPDAPFRENFPSAKEYAAFAKTQLAAIAVKDWKLLKSRKVAEDQMECIVVMLLSCAGVEQYFYELALVVHCDKGWLYHSAQKLSVEDYSGHPDKLDFIHFDQVQPKIRM